LPVRQVAQQTAPIVVARDHHHGHNTRQGHEAISHMNHAGADPSTAITPVVGSLDKVTPACPCRLKHLFERQ
jgi:hypothetical protein